MQEVCSVIDPQIKTESLMPLQTVILSNQTLPPTQQQPLQNGQQQQQQPHNLHNQPPAQPNNKMGTNCDKRSAAAATAAPDNSAYWMPTETGFINSQPSMAEFLTHLGPDSSPKMDQTHYGNPPGPDGGDSVPEYPWMKEKKTARKNNGNSSK